jgi:hypothetical protein
VAQRGQLEAMIKTMVAEVKSIGMVYIRTVQVQDYETREHYLIVDGWRTHPGNYGPRPSWKDIKS